MKRPLLTALLAAALASTSAPLLAAEPVSTRPAAASAQAAVDPAAQIRRWGRLFRHNDVSGLAQAAVPPPMWEEIRLAYELAQLEPTRDVDRAGFADALARFADPGAVDILMAEIEPQLDRARPQLPGAMLLAFGAMHVAVNAPDSGLDEAQRGMLRDAIPGVQAWISRTDFLNPATMRQALTLVTDAVRHTGIRDLDELKAMPLEATLDHAGPVLAAAKQALRLYGLDLDAVVDTLRVDVLAADADHARVRTTVTVFGAPVWIEHDLVQVEGRWYGKHAARQWRGRHSIVTLN
jgi:hypothetical protein